MTRLKLDEEFIIEAVGNERIKSLDDLLKETGYSKELWEVVWSESNMRTTSMKLKTDAVKQVENLQIKAKLKPISSLVKPDVKDVLMKVFGDKVPTLKVPAYKNGPLLANINIADTHLGRLNEKHHDKYLRSIQDRTLQLFELLLKHKPDKLLFGNLGDFFNSEPNGATTNGTKQENGLSAREMFQKGLRFHIELIQTLASELPTDVIIIPGNHDKNVLMQLGDALELYFSKSDGINIDNREATRRYYDWGKTTLAFSHGDGEKEKEMLKIFAQEHGLNDHNYRTRGHFHERQVKQQGALETDVVASTAVQSTRERNQFADKPGKLIGKLYDKKYGKTAEYSK